ncbi:SH3 domain-containing protein [Larkinella soli]|uniref:SH3 domain-containing protein n=1 Tax=Larkinella soli TaxID=1770527 RepID=UPI000FFB75CD|nr:SH3 domain-containing protein [Larkinella soli]
MSQLLFRVSDKASQGLNLRSQPVVKDNTKKAVLPMGHRVTKKAEAPVAPWWEVSTTIEGTDVEGFVSSAFLVPETAFVPPLPHSSLSPVHLSTNKPVVRANKDRMAFALNEPGQKTRDKTGSGEEKAAQLTAIVNWLGVEKNNRYAPTPSQTFCNIYAYDYCFLAGAYLPRVWWSATSLDKLGRNIEVAPIFAQTVNELNANSLFNWLKEFGPTFGWTRTFDFTQMQNAANDGLVVVVCAQNKVPNRSGHITAIVPETDVKKAKRTGTAVAEPLQSQAGRNNQAYFTRNWWTAPTFRDFGFWINAS